MLRPRTSRLLVLCGLGLVVGAVPAWGQDLRVVVTGDSLTTGYATRLDTLLAGDGTGRAFSVAQGGCDSNRYTGKTPDPVTATYRHFDEEVVAKDPDIIVLLLGTNDVGKATYQDWTWPGYRANIAEVLDTFAAAVNGRGNTPRVLVGTLLPLLGDPGSLNDRANALIEADFNPFLIQEAARRGLGVIDFNTLIQQQPAWRSFYDADGIHLWANGAAGYDWMAQTVRDAIVAELPEPASTALLALGALAALRRRRR